MDSGTSEMFEVAEACVKCRCGCCKDECPMYSEIVEESISPKGRNILIRAIGKGELEPDERAVRIAYSCLLCKRDEFSCSARLKNAEATEAFREYLVSRGVPGLIEHDALVKSLQNYGNPWQEPKGARKRWARDLKARAAVPGKTEVLFYVGCTFALDRSLQETPRALAKLMDIAGEEYGLLLDDELCCGSTAKRIGHRELFERLRKENEARIRKTGARRVVTACSGCYKTLKQDYPGLNKNIRVLHSAEYLEEIARSERVSFSSYPHKLTYHDPCHLGRHAEVYDAPRRLLRAIPDVIILEMRNSRERSRCCGGGAGVKTAYPEISQAAARRRIREAEQTGAEALVTACPFCVQTLRAAADASGSSIEVIELTVLLGNLAKKGGSAA